MKRMTYKTLMRKINDGYAEVWAWGRDNRTAEVIFYTANGKSRRERVEVLNAPKPEAPPAE